jgi:pSer/pThr/pTyr-binding forkhead associated (FHA) protein
MFQLESSDDLGRKLVFPLVKVMTTIGRDPNCDIVLADDDVSRHHAKVYLMAGAVKVKDENSVNGTYVNNARIGEMTVAPLNAEIIIGSNQFFLRQAADVIEEDLRLTSVLTIRQLRDMTFDYQSLLDEMPPDGDKQAQPTNRKFWKTST